ncbi:MAG: hypothetical protein J7K80_01345, partial [Candidatus Izimaplasma sp.]|nr:hypothetical protein [Candidatus Izimaplasma bacterium]
IMLDGIISTIEGLIPVQSFIDSSYDFVNNLGIIEQIIGMLVLAIVGIMGTIELVKKLSKIIIVFAILGGLWFLYSGGFLDGIIG